MRLAEWTTGSPCDADNIVYYHRCKPRDLPPHVYRSAWSTAFHKAPGCKALTASQGSVERRGGSPPEVVGVHVGVAISSGLAPCLHCFPSFRGRA
jgi:hypothetical protein